MMHSVASSHTSRSRGLHNTPEASDAAQDRAPVSPATSLGRLFSLLRMSLPSPVPYNGS
jgi:hypothetical protein